MAKTYTFVAFCFVVLLPFLAGCQGDDSNLKNEASVQKLPDSKNDITVKTEQAEYQPSVKEIIIEIQNDSNKNYTTGVHVFLEKKVEDTWYDVPMKADAFTEIGIIHPPNKLSSLSLDVNDLDYKLTTGEYRATIAGLAAPFEVVE